MPTPSDALFSAYYPTLSQTNIRRGMRRSLLDAYRLPSLEDLLAQPEPPRGFAEQQLNTILNAQARLASVGAPVPPPEQNTSLLEGLVNLLNADRNLLFGGLAQAFPGLENERWFQALREGGGEFLEELGVENPLLRFLGGTAIDILTSPLSYLSFGIGTLAREGAQALAREGLENASRRFIVNLQVPFTSTARTVASADAERLLTAAERAAAPVVDRLRPYFSRGGASATLPSPLRSAIQEAQEEVFAAERAIRGLSRREIEEARKRLRELGADKMDPKHHRLAFLAGEGDAEAIQQIADLRRSNPNLADRITKLAQFMREQMDRLYEEEQAAGLAYRRFPNYLPHLVEGDEDAARDFLRSLESSISTQTRARTTERAFFRLSRSKSEARELEDAGFKVIYDPERVVAIRFFQSVKARANHALANRLRELAKATDDGTTAILKIPSRVPKGQQRPNPPKDWVPAEMLLDNLIDRYKDGRVKARYYLHPELARAITNLNESITNRKDIEDLFRTVELANGLFKGIVTGTPGKVLRDFLGNVFNAIIAGTPPVRFLSSFVASMRSWAPEVSEQVAVRSRAGTYTWKDLHDILWRNNLVSSGEVEDITGLLRRVGEETNSRLERATRVVRKWPVHRLAAAVDTNSKLALLRDFIAQGLDPETAARRVRRYLFDYSDLTPTEKRIFRNLFPFYTFWRKELPVLFEGFFSHPELFKAAGYAHQEAKSSFELTDEELPDWIRQNLGLVFRIGERYYSGSLGFPVDPLASIESPTEGAGDFLQSVGRYVASQITPLVRAPLIELPGNVQLYSGSPIQSREGQTVPLGVGGAQVQVDPRLVYLFEQLVPVAGRALVQTLRPDVEEVSELPPRPEQSALEQLLRGISGMSSFASPFNPDRQAAIQGMLYARQLLDQITNLQRQGIPVPTTDELGIETRPRLGEQRALEALTALLQLSGGGM